MNFKGIFILCVLTAGCGLREVTFRDGTSTTELFLGPGTTVSCTADPGVSAEVTTLGLWWEARGGGLGYHSGRYQCGSPECQVVIWADENFDPERLRSAFGGIENVCIVQ